MGRNRFGRESGQRFVNWMQHRGLQSFNPCRRFRHHEEPGADPAAGGGGGGDPGAAGGGDPGAAGGGGDPGGGADPKTSFSQDQVNAILKREKDKQEAKYKDQIRMQIAEVTKMKDEKDLTEAQRAKLDERAKTLQAELLTEREKADAEKRRADEKHKTELDGVSVDRDTWRGRYETQTRTNAILEAASKHEAYMGSQLVGLIKDLVDVAPEVDGAGNPTEKFETSITAKVKDGEELVEKKFTVDGYVEHMKGLDEFANLFIVTRPGGTGHRQGGVEVGGKSTANMTSTEKIAAGLAGGQASAGSTKK